MKAVVTLVPIIYKTEDWISWSVSLLIWPLWTKWEGSYFPFTRFEVVYCQCCRVWI